MREKAVGHRETKKGQPLPARPSRMRWAVGGALLVIGIVAGWWISGGPDAWGDRPRLIVDREVVDLGDLPFGAPARVVFTLTNAGPGTLKLAGVPRVEAVKGC